MTGRGRTKRGKAFWLALGCGGVLCVLTVLGLGDVFWYRTLIYTGSVQDKSRLAALPWEVRQSLSVLPEGAQDIHYSVRPYPPAEVEADFRIPRGDFLRWMKDNGWPAQRITMGQSLTEPEPGGYTLDLPSVDGYGWSGTQEKQLIFEDSHLDVQVVFDTADEHAYYGHYEIIPGRDDPRSGDAH